MLQSYLFRGLKAGLVAGLAFGVFVALVANPLVGFTEALAGGHNHGEAADHGEAEHHGESGSGLLDTVSTDAVSIVAGAFWGLLLGVVAFGVVFYFLEPAIPGAEDTASYLLGGAGFLTVSGAPWLVLPPQPPGVESAIPVDTRILWYAGAMLAGAVACALAGYAYNRVRSRGRGVALLAAVVPLGTLFTLPLVAPGTTGTAAIPSAAAFGFRALVVVGQLGLWLVLAATHAWLLGRTTTQPSAVAAPHDAPSAD